MRWIPMSLLCATAFEVLNAADATIIARGPHHRVWQKLVPVTLPDGRTSQRPSQYIELATGLNYWNGSEWLESREEIEVVDGGAVAEQGQHKASFAANINSAPAIQIRTPDDKVFRTRVLGIVYYDPVSGQSELIGELRDSIGDLVAPNQIIYRDCFLGVKADVRVTYTKAGLEQDIILRERPNAPAFYALSDESRLQVWTELFDPPTPRKETQVLREEENEARRREMRDPDFKDEVLDFGHMRITRGKAFSIEADVGVGDDNEVVIGKEWARVDGRDFLIESAEHRTLEPLLETLPAAVTAKRLKPENKRHLTRSEVAGMLSRIQPREHNRGLQMARMEPKRDKGVVLDYLLVSSQSNFTFRGDATYYVSSGYTLSGTTTIEGGAVIKATNSSASKVRLSIQGPVVCNTGPYRPVVFTSKDDDTVGEIIAGSSGNPTTNYYGYYLVFSGNTNAIDLHDLYFRYAEIALYLNGASGVTLRHAQISDSHTGFGPGTFRARNLLIENGVRAMGGAGVFHGEQITFHGLDALRSAGWTDNNLTNCLIISVTNNLVFSGVNVFTNHDDSGIFQTAGGGSHYLADGSPHRNAGTTNINPDLLADLRKKTTYPPILFSSNTVSINTTLTPQAQRDTDVLDLGYHYSPLDYFVYFCTVTNATVTLSNGVSVGTVGWPGFWLVDGSSLVSEGSPINRNHIARAHTVQENALNWGPSPPSSAASIVSYASGALSSGKFRFTDFDGLSAGGKHFYSDESWTFANLSIRDCEFNSGDNNLAGGESTTFSLTNNLFLSVSNYFGYYPDFFAYNNLFKGGGCVLERYGALAGYANQWVFHDNAFDGVALVDAGETVTHSHNAYIAGTTQLVPTNSTDKVVSTLNYETGPLGRFYQPTNSALTNLGSRLASAATLYHFTLHTNQVKEASSQVDMGYHYVAVNAQNQPVDGDGDGLPDYLEDKDGDGVVDGNETSFTNPDSDGDGVSDHLEWIQGRNPFTNSVADTGNLINLRVYTPLK